MLIKIAVVYLVLSFVVACHVVVRRIAYCNYMMDVPYGDWEYHSYKRPVTESLKYVFLPALLMIGLHYAGIKLLKVTLFRD